jgi:hypothetical protein
LQAEEEVSVAREPVDLGDDQRGAICAASLECRLELRAVAIVFAALDLGELGSDRPAPAV